MGIAYSPGDKLFFSPIAAESSSELRASIAAVASMVGWTKIRDITGGSVYELTSPQADVAPTLKARLKVQETGRELFEDVSCIDLTMMSADETRVGFAHYLSYGPGVTRQLWASPCQFFFSEPFQRGTTGTAVMGGIPFVPLSELVMGGSCIQSTELTSEVWWSLGDSSAFSSHHWKTFREAFLPVSLAYSTCYNGVVGLPDTVVPNFTVGPPRLVPVTDTHPWYGWMPPTSMTWLDGTGLRTDSLITWNTQLPPLVRGQLWDSFVESRPNSVESIVVDSDDPTGNTQFVCYSTNVSDFGTLYPYSLFLRTPPPVAIGGESNYAY